MAAFKTIDERIDRRFEIIEKKAIFCFAYVGHGVEIQKSLNILLPKDQSSKKF